MSHMKAQYRCGRGRQGGARGTGNSLPSATSDNAVLAFETAHVEWNGDVDGWVAF
jgi:hypothetical protein